MAARSRAFRRVVLEVLKNHGPQVSDSFAQRPPGRRAWRSDAAVLAGGAANVAQDDIPALCHASDIGDETVRRGDERAEDEGDS